MGPVARAVTRRWWFAMGLVVLSACGGSTEPKTVVSVEVTPSTLTLAPGQSSTVTATALDILAAPIAGRAATWTSSNSSVATVSAAGLVTGVSDGTATITARIGTLSANVAVTVRTPVGSVVVTPPTASITIGDAPLQLTAIARSPAGTTLVGREVQWSSATPAIATVSSTGQVTAVATGSAVITATVDGTSGSATIQVSQNPCTIVRGVTIGQTVGGSLAATDCKLSDNTATQRYEFTVNAPTKLEILMSSTAVDAYLFLTDAAFNIIDQDDDGGGTTDARILRTVAAGRYFVIANTFTPNQFGAYLLSVLPAPAACVTGRSAVLPSTIDAALAATSCRLTDRSFEDRYDFTITTRTTIVANMTSTAIDPILVVLDNAERVVAQDDDSGAGDNASLEVQLDPGRYTILARGYPGETGAYRLQVGPAIDPCAVTRTIAPGQTVSGTFSSTDCTISDGGGPSRFFQRFGLTLGAATAIQLDMLSNAVDAYLIVQNAQTGATVAENDDVSTSSTNSRIIANLPAGQYIVNTTTFNAGEVGFYQLTASAIVSGGGVTIAVLPTTLALQPGQTQQATATVSGAANTAVTWTSNTPNVATVSTSGLVRAITPGTAVITATAQANPARTASLTVTVGQANNETNLDIAALYLVQSVQQLDGRVPLVADRRAVARVFVRGSRAGLAAVPVRVRIVQNGNTLGTFEGTATPTLSVDESCCSANINIPGTAIRPGVTVVADVDPNNTVTESNETDNQFPLSGTPQPLTVVTVPPFNVRLVPVQQNRNGPLAVANATLFNVFGAAWPFNVINATVRQPLVIDYVIGSQSFDSWIRLVRDVEIVRQTEGGAAYYYGLVRTAGTSGVLGLANGIPARTAIGVDEGSDFGAAEARLTFAHEMGHTLGLRHAPCGGAAGPDPNYPFPNGQTGAWGMDTFNGNAIKPPTSNDIMTYCPSQWVSAYNYRKVFDYHVANPLGSGISLPTNVLMISGSVSAGSVVLDPAFSVRTLPARQDFAGRFVVEGFDASDRLLFAHRFSPYRVDDATDGTEAFVVAVPVSDEQQSQVARLSVRELTGTRKASRLDARRLPLVPGSPTEVSATRSAGGRVQMTWMTTRVPAVMVRDRRTGEVLAIVRNGTLDLSQFGTPDRVDVLLSDGVKSARVRIDPLTGALRQ